MTAYAGKATGIDYTKYLEQEDYYYKKGDGNVVYGDNAQADTLRGLNSLDQRAVFNQYVEGRNGKQRDLFATELVFSPPKTVSFAAMCKDEKVRNIATSAHQAAVKEAMNEVENHHFYVRKKEHGRQENYKATGMVGVGFTHFMNREGEPQLHSHVLIANSGLIEGEDQTRSVNFDSIYQNQKRFDRIYQARLQYEFEKAGIKTESKEGGKTFEIAGIDRAKIEQKSTRYLQVNENTKKLIIAQKLNDQGFKTKFTPDGVEPKGRLGQEKKEAFNEAKSAIETDLEGQDIRKISTAAQRNAAAKMYRKSKRSVDQEEAKKQIGEDLEKMGVDIQIREKMEERDPAKVRDLIYKGYEEYIGREGISNRSNAVASIINFAGLERNKDESLPMITHEDICKHLPGAMAKEEMIRLPGQKLPRGDNKELLVSRKLLRADAENQQYLVQGNGRYEYLDSSRVESDLQKALDKGLFDHEFKGEQRDASIGILKSKNFITACVGDPGTGKTTMLRAVTAVQGKDNIIAVSKAGVAADKLGKEIGVTARTIDKFAIDYDRRKEVLVKPGPLDSRDHKTLKDTAYIDQALSGSPEKPSMIIVDEASMAGDFDMNRLCHIAEENHAKIVMTGDYQQLPGVGVGEVFKKYCESGNIEKFHLKEIYRQKDDDYKAAVEAITIAQDARKAVGILAEKPDSLKEIKSERDRVDKIQYDYMQRVKNGEAPPLLITGRNKDKDQLNAGLRDRLKSIDHLDRAGEIHEVFYDARGNKKDIELCAQERIVFLENDNKNKIQTSSGEKILNGHQGIISVIKDGLITGNMVDEEGKKLEDTFSFSVSDYNRLDYAYALSVHKSQGQSVSRHVMYHAPSDSNLLSKNEFLVGISRNKNNLSVYTDNIEEMTHKSSSWVVKKDALQTYERGQQRMDGRSEKVNLAVSMAEEKLDRNDELKAIRAGLVEQYGEWKKVPKSDKESYFSASIASREQFHADIRSLGLVGDSEVDTKSEFHLASDLESWEKNLGYSEARMVEDNTKFAQTNHFRRVTEHDNALCRQILSLKGNAQADQECRQDYQDIKKDLARIRSEEVFKTEIERPVEQELQEIRPDINPDEPPHLEELPREDQIQILLEQRENINQEINSFKGGLSEVEKEEVFSVALTTEEQGEYSSCQDQISKFDQQYDDLQDQIGKAQFDLDKVDNEGKTPQARVDKLEETYDGLVEKQTDIDDRRSVYQNRYEALDDKYQDALQQKEQENDTRVDELFAERDQIDEQLEELGHKEPEKVEAPEREEDPQQPQDETDEQVFDDIAKGDVDQPDISPDNDQEYERMR